jgi:hypothetical protein
MGILRGMGDISKTVGYSESTVLIWIKTKKFPATKVSGNWLAYSDDVIAWLREYVKKDVQTGKNLKKIKRVNHKNHIKTPKNQ